MDNKDMQQQWNDVKGKLLAEDPHLTEEELIREIGKDGEHLKALQDKLGHNWKEMKNWLALLG